MNAVDVIIKKRDGHELSREEIDYFVQGYTHGAIPDYQAAAWAMAVLWRGMTRQETVDLTLCMAQSGATMDLHDVAAVVVDKHSTGGVGDKTTIVVAPLVAACGLPVGKMSGRGLGFSGGTLDKLEAIPGYDTALSVDRFKAQLRQVGVVVSGQTVELAPADGKLYALRDVTGTVPSLPLIASSIMSKKIAAGADAIVLDVKVGRGAFMATLEDATSLAQTMVDIGKGVGRRVSAVLSDMDQPLGRAVGNALEVAEALDTLRGRGPADLVEHCLVTAAEMLVLGGVAEDSTSARRLLVEAIQSGRALNKFHDWIAAQGGSLSVVGDPPGLQAASIIREVSASRSGVIGSIDAMAVGLAAVDLGAGRAQKGDTIDHAVGVVLRAKVGDEVRAGDALYSVHANREAAFERARERLSAAYSWSDRRGPGRPLVYGVLR